MARFACPTGSTYSAISSEVSCPAKKAGVRVPPKSLKRESSITRREERLSSAKEAKKKDEARKKQEKKENEFPIVFVGNLMSGITATELSDLFFAQCGRANRIDIRCSYGNATVPSSDSTTAGRRYASLLWRNYTSYLKALRLNGRVLQGRPIIVTITPGDLPEVKDLVLGRIQERNQAAIPRHLQHCIREPTLIIAPTRSSSSEDLEATNSG